MSVEELTSALETYIRESPRNYVDEAMALVPSDVGQRLYDTPLVRVGSADDPEWEEMKRPEAVGHLFRTPKEWLPEAVSVVSYFAPFSDFVVEGNKRDAVDVGNGWLYARVEGQAFLTEVNRFLERWFRERGYRAVAPYASAGFRYVFEAGTNAEIADKSLSFTSNWSERHVAYVCGLGTFSLSKGLITERGGSGRFGSVVTDAPLPVTKRRYTGLYDYCSMCGACVRNCPAQAISLEHGKSHHLCCSYFDTLREKYALRFGCGKCQVNVPCERENPQKRISSVFELHFVRKEASPYPDVKTECSFGSCALREPPKVNRQRRSGGLQHGTA